MIYNTIVLNCNFAESNRRKLCASRVAWVCSYFVRAIILVF